MMTSLSLTPLPRSGCAIIVQGFPFARLPFQQCRTPPACAFISFRLGLLAVENPLFPGSA